MILSTFFTLPYEIYKYKLTTDSKSEIEMSQFSQEIKDN